MKQTIYIFLAIAFILPAGPALAKLSLRQKKVAKQHDKYLKKSIVAANKDCGTKLKAIMDWETFKGEMEKQFEGKLNVAFYSFCGEVLDTIGAMCREDADAKQAIAGTIKTIKCRFGGKGKRKLALKKGALTWTIDWKAPNNGKYVRKFLGKKL